MQLRIWRYLRHHHLGLLALFVALSGTAYAASSLPAGSVGTKQLKNHAVTLAKISKGARHALRGRRGPRGLQGVSGAAGSAKAYGVVYTLGNGKPASLVESSGNVTLTHPSQGQWCLAVAGVDPLKEPIIATLSNSANYNAVVFSGLGLPPCPSTSFRVLTTQTTADTGNGTGAPSDEPFAFMVP